MKSPDGARLVPCPACGEFCRFSPENPWRPFCSERCRNHDLGAWANEDYRVAVKPTESDDDLPEAAPAQRH